MRRRTILGLTLLLALFVLALSILPTQGAVTTGGAQSPTGPYYVIHYEPSPSCDIFPFGISYWDDGIILGCGGPSIP